MLFWLSTAVVNISPAFTGIVELRGIMTFISPPKVSIPSDKGVTSSSRTFLNPPDRISAWIAAPRATEQIMHKPSDQRHSCLTSHQNYLVQVLGVNLGICQRTKAVGPGPSDDV